MICEGPYGASLPEVGDHFGDHMAQLISCMGARGYRPDANGPLTIPNDAVISTYQSFGNVRWTDEKL